MTVNSTPLTDATLLRDAAAVKRYHTKRTVRAQTNGQHSFDMLTLLLTVLPFCSKQLMLAVMLHDLPELVTGDTPGPAKRSNPVLSNALADMEESTGILFYSGQHLTEEERTILKWLDRMEAVLWCMEEYQLGNQNIVTTMKCGLTRIVQAGTGIDPLDWFTRQVLHRFLSWGFKLATSQELENTI